MSELVDEIEDLLKKGEEEKAFVLIKDKDSKVKNSLAEELIERGSNLIEKEEYDLAITYFDFAYEIAIDSEIKENARKHLTDAYNKRGNVYHNLNRNEKAIADYNKAIELNPNFAMAYNNRGVAYYGSNKNKEAIADYNKAIELNPNFYMAYSNRGLAYDWKKEFEKAIDDFDKAIKLNPDDALAYFNRGVAYGVKEEFEKAIDNFDKAIDLNHDDAVAYFNRGLAYHKKKDFEKAIDDFGNAIKLNPGDAAAYYNRGVAYGWKEDFEKAIDDFGNAIKLNPGDAVAYYNRGLAHYKLESYRKAKRDYNKAIKLDKNFDIAHANLGDLLYTIEEDYDTAEKEYREALNITEAIDYAHNGLGLVLSKRKAYKEAIAEFKKALKLNKAADFYNNLGCAYAEYGKGSAISLISFLNAQNNFKKATQGRNTYVEAHKHLTSVGELLINELKLVLFRIFIILFVFVLSIELFGLSKDNWLEITLILTGVAILGIVLFSDFMKIRIKSLGIPGVVELEFEYEKPKARKEAFQFADPSQPFELVEPAVTTIYTSTEAKEA